MKKKALVCALLTGGLLLGASVPVMAASGKFDVSQEDQKAYDEAFGIGADHVTAITNNGGKYGSSKLQYFIDGNTSTHWETGKPNSASFANEVIFTFDQPIQLGSLVYYPRVQGDANKGFPTAYSVYSSDSKTGDDFKLAAKGSASIASGGTQIRFQPTVFTRLKFVFDKANRDWAAGAEMAFYAPDDLPETVDDLFTDGTMSALKPKYQNAEVLEKLLAEAKEHPNKRLQERVQMALDIFQGKEDYTGQVFQVEQRGDMSAHSQTVLKTGGYSSNILPTGISAKPGEVVRIYVDTDEGAPLPAVVFSQQIGTYYQWERSFALHEGENILTVPMIYSESWAATKVIPGGAIYLSNPYTPDKQGSAPRVRIAGGERYPLFRDGDNVQEFLEELQAYKTKLEANPETTVDIVELYSDWFILNGNVRAANSYLTGAKNPQDTVEFHNTRQQQLLAFAGIDDRSFVHSRNNCRANLRLMQPYGMGYAAGGHVGTQQGCINNFFNGGVGWLYSHELGHLLDTREGYIGEVTNNMWANHIAVDVQGEYDRVSYNAIFKNQASDNYQELVNRNDEVAMWWQLHLLNENYWPNYQSAYREGVLANAGLTGRERMAVISCYAVGMDVIEHFERYKFIERNDRIDAALAALNIPEAPDNVKPWYLWTKATKDRQSAFTQEYIPEITSVEREGSSVKVSMTIDPSADSALLGYEVMEDGRVLGFTSGSTFTGNFTDDGQEHAFTVRAYDLRMNQTQPSQPKGKNLKEPVIRVNGSTLAVIHGTFDPLSVVSAKSWDGKDISDSLQVVSNPVNTEEKGIYEVVYQAQDADGTQTQETVEIQVVSRFDYLSDLQEAAASVGYSTLTKDKAINGTPIALQINGGQVTFEKGLGAHAPSSITYEIGGAGYSFFEAYVGIDRAMAGSKASNAIFKVLADGQVIYESQPMKSDTDAQHLKLDIRGVSRLELATGSNGSKDSDHTVWADAKFAAEDSAPVINGEDAVYTQPEDVNLDTIVGGVTAHDVEDGDLTGALTYETNFLPGGTGVFDITYSVTDSDGNRTDLTRKIVVVNDYVYASDVDWKSAKVGWGSIKKDKSLNGNQIKLGTENGIVAYDKGIGVHAHSEVVYDLTDKDYYYFTGFAGVDQSAGNNNSSVVFRIYTDGVLAAETPLMRKGTPAQFLCVDVSGAKQVKLVVTDGGNGNANDHANWADAKFLTAVKTADKAELGRVIEAAKALNEAEYTTQSWAEVSQAMAAAQEIYDSVRATQEETDSAANALTAAVNRLKKLLDTQALQKAREFAGKMDSLDYVDPQLTHRETRLYNLKAYLEETAAHLESGDLDQTGIDQAEKAILYFIEETGQVYQPEGEPVNFAEGQQAQRQPEEMPQNSEEDTEQENAEQENTEQENTEEREEETQIQTIEEAV